MKFPQRLFVKHIKDGDDTYYAASDDWTELIEQDESVITAAVYELVEVGKLITKSEFMPSATKLSSTACRRVKVGTQTDEQDVYETVCDELMPYGETPAPEPQVVDDLTF